MRLEAEYTSGGQVCTSVVEHDGSYQRKAHTNGKFSRNRVGGGKGQLATEVEFAAEEEDPGALVGEVAEAAGIGFDGSDLRVEIFSGNVGDGMLEVGKQINRVGFEGAGDGHDLGQAAPHGGAVTSVKLARAARGIRSPQNSILSYLVQLGSERL